MTSSTDVEILRQNLTMMDSAIRWLSRSYQICSDIGIKGSYTPEEYDAFETLTSRYARAIDLMLRKVLRAVDAVELEIGGTLIDTINRAEKKG
ncbi:MAG: hypothetical protein ACREV4_05995 [Gammaproteobacteria bacterium]